VPASMLQDGFRIVTSVQRTSNGEQQSQARSDPTRYFHGIFLLTVRGGPAISRSQPAHLLNRYPRSRNLGHIQERWVSHAFLRLLVGTDPREARFSSRSANSPNTRAAEKRPRKRRYADRAIASRRARSDSKPRTTLASAGASRAA